MTAPRSAKQRSLSAGATPLHGRVVDELRRLIVERHFRPGERLIEERLADELGVSRNPVREAIRMLAAEGLVRVSANRGAAVSSMTAQEARETIELRALLEGHNARLATRRQDREVLKRIQAVLAKGARAVEQGRLNQLGALNGMFHAELAAASQNTVLGDMLKRLRDRTAMLFSQGDRDYQHRTWTEHAAILRAIIDGDERQAALLAAQHVMRAGSEYFLAVDTELPWQAAGEPAGAPEPRRPAGRRAGGRRAARPGT
jgi:DNA-binding GntR family transcriptional regulator